MMTAVQQFTGGAGLTLLVLAMVLSVGNRLPQGGGPAGWSRWALIAAVAVAVWIPWSHSSAISILRGVLGDLSITMMILLGAFVVEQLSGRILIGSASRTVISVGVAMGGMILYPMTLGLSVVDPYRLGFQPLPLPAVLLPVVLVAWWRQPAVAWILFAALIAANLRLLESTNLWDYLLDVWVTLAAVAWILARILHPLVRGAVATNS